MGPRKEGAGRMGVRGPPRPGQLGTLQLLLGFREEESYSRWRSSLETRVSSSQPPRPSGATCPLPGHSPILQLCPEPCQAFGTQTGCLLKESAGETGSPAFAHPHFLPRGRWTLRTPGGGRRALADEVCLLAPLMPARRTAAVQGTDTSAHVKRNQCTTNTAFTVSKAPLGAVACALLSGVHRALAPAWPRSPTLWGCAHLRSRAESGPAILSKTRSVEGGWLRAPAPPEHWGCSKGPLE